LHMVLLCILPFRRPGQKAFPFYGYCGKMSKDVQYEMALRRLTRITGATENP